MSNMGVWIAFYLFLNTCMSIQHSVTENSSSLPHYNNSISEGGNPAHRITLNWLLKDGVTSLSKRHVQHH